MGGEMMIRRGTYARERDGGSLLYHSDALWNDASYGLQRYLESERTSHSSRWRIVTGDEAEAVWKAYRVGPGEYVEVENDA
jgi:hypothetical protein